MPESPNTPAPRYYPALKNLIALDSIPESLGFVRTFAENVFSKIFYKRFISSISNDGSKAFYALDIVTKDRLELELFSGLKFILNRDFDDQGVSAFPVKVHYEWPILSYLKYFNLAQFSFSPQEFYQLGLIVLNITEQQVVLHALSSYVSVTVPGVKPVNRLVDELNVSLSGTLTSPISYPTSRDKISELISDIYQKSGMFASQAIFLTYMANSNIQDTINEVNLFYSVFFPDNIEGYIISLIKPEARVSLDIAASIEFPRNILIPWNDAGTAPNPDPNSRAYFDFAKATLFADTKGGVGYQAELAGTLNPAYCEIGNTGLLIQIDSLKLDLSKNSNIPEAIADGRPDDFVGVYARAISVTLPSTWFHEDSEPVGNVTSTLRVGAYNLLIGTGGLSGTIALETVPVQGSSSFEYFNQYFSFVYPIFMHKENTDTGEIEEIMIANYNELKAYLISLNDQEKPYIFKFPLSITPIGSSTITEIIDVLQYQQYLAALTDGTFWKTIGGSDGFRVGFTSFDITFKQNKVIHSSIAGGLEIKKFKYPEDHLLANQTVRIGIAGHIEEDGGFKLTATVQDYPIRLPGVFTYNLKTVTLGRDDDDSPFYLETSGSLQFLGFLADNLKLGPIEIQSLRIYSDGSMEFSGGSISLLEPIPLPLGPVTITVSAIHYGSIQKEVNGEMRKFSYFGFDGGLNVDPLGIEIRGDGVKYYYCTDDKNPPLSPYLHIETIHLDLTIPLSSPVAIINGWLSIPEPGVSPEYKGGLKLQLPRVGITGSVDMRLMPKYPAFILDAEIEFPAPIPLGTFAIYGFRGLLGYRYVAEKEAIGLVSHDNTWYEYYKKPPRGIHVEKFSGPNQTVGATDPFSIGAGASLGTSFDNGTVLNMKVMLLLSIPSVFMLDGRVSILSARLGLEDTKEPPFFIMAAIGEESLEFGFGADFKMPTSTGSMLKLYAEMQAAFFFNDSSKWYVNFGTREKPTTATILSLVEIKSYLMLSAKGIEAGARGEFDFKRTYAGIIKVHAWAYIEIGGKISFERPQFGAYLDAGVGAEINVKIVDLHASFDILFAVEASEPFLIYGRVRISIRIKIAWVFKFSFNKEVEVLWEKSKNVDTRPVNPLINANNLNAIPNLVKGINMLSNETFDLKYLGETVPANTFNTEILTKVIPLDTYIDIKTEKGFLPAAIGNLIGGVSNPPSRYTDLIPPDPSIKGKPLRQVRHQYSVSELSLKFWLPAPAQGNPNAGLWKDYHPYKALYPAPDPADPAQTAAYNSLKIGQFQKSDRQYNTIRILATTPFSYTEQGEPGWYIPEQYGMTASTLFCEGDRKEPRCANFLHKELGMKYFCFDINHMFYSNEAAFLLIDKDDDDFAEISNHPNVFQFAQSLAFDIHNKLQIILPAPSVFVRLKLTSDSQAVRIRYYATKIDTLALEVQYGHPDPSAANQNSSYNVVVNVADLNQPIIFDNPSWRPITKIIIEPIYGRRSLIGSVSTELATLQNVNNLVQLGAIPWYYQSPISLMRKLDNLRDYRGRVVLRNYLYNINNNEFTDKSDIQWQTSWDVKEGKKVEGNSIGFYYDDGTVNIDSNNQLADITLQPDFPEYEIENEGAKALIKVKDINPYINEEGNIELSIYLYENCDKDKRLCTLHNNLSAIQSNFISPDIATKNDFPVLQKSMIRFKKEIDTYVAKYPDYDLTEIVDNPIKDIDGFINAPDPVTYPLAHGAALTIVGGIRTEGNCKCVEDCKKDEVLCGLYNTFSELLQSCIHDPMTVKEEDLSNIRTCTEEFISSFYVFDSKYSSYELNKKYENQINSIKKFLEGPTLENYSSSYAAVKEITAGIEFTGDCNCGGECDKDELLCALYNTFEDLLKDCIKDPKVVKENELPEILNCVEVFIGAFYEFDNKNSSYLLEETYASQMDFIKKFYDEPTIENYAPAYNAVKEIIAGLADTGNCNCGDTGTLEDLYNNIKDIFDEHLQDTGGIKDFTEQIQYVHIILDLINQFNIQHPEVDIIKDLTAYIDILNEFLNNPTQQTLEAAIAAIQAILDYLNQTGGTQYDKLPEKTLLHEVCWLSREDYEYNINIPLQPAIAADAQAAVNGITKYVQPIWRPDTSYLVHFKLKDTVYNGQDFVEHEFRFTYGFTTAGPVGHFHTAPESTYGDVSIKANEKIGDFIVPQASILDDPNGILRKAATGEIYPAVVNNAITPHPQQYALTSLSRYIDYSRSYPNADSNLLGSKPLFYDADELTRIDLYYLKAYATHFFMDWQPYNGAPSRSGRIKVVIKDPAEADEIINPPYLDFDPEDVTTVHIPQAVEDWLDEPYPLTPFVISQWSNLYNADDNCLITPGDAIRPASQYTIIKLKNLKPSKLYTAIVNNLYDKAAGSNFDVLDDTREVHRFVFQTSRYADFAEQVNSYLLHEGTGQDYVERKAIFTVSRPLTAQQIDMAYKTMTNVANPADTYIINYQHKFDRIIEGVLGLNPLNEAISTEFNIIRNTADNNKAVAIIIKNPEPFNIPKITDEFLADTIEVLSSGFTVVHSKDYSQAIIMHTSKVIAPGTLNIKFRFKMWNGLTYVEVSNVPPLSIEIS